MHGPSIESPLDAYRDFLAAVRRRDIDGTLARMSAGYASDLKSMLAEAHFRAFFALWCDTYPERIDLVACTLFGADKALIQTQGRIDGLAFSGSALLDRVGLNWRVSAETHSEIDSSATVERLRKFLQSVETQRQNPPQELQNTDNPCALTSSTTMQRLR